MTEQSPSIGDNHKPRTVNGVAGERILSFIERVERLNEEKRAIADDIKEVFKEAKDLGFDNSVIRELIRERAKERKNPAAFKEHTAMVDTYKAAVGMV